ncbi:hypothetical protein [Streptomyces sp. NBC_01244]|uniref:hypothetical protein n=1 Tax=Streptomyces sp. NBC_01244 TaxID=2903797 RepID=UPI002E11A63F|nr:hypothetical protein OG247_00950 [Streptomyces sp. NBC_01244]
MGVGAGIAALATGLLLNHGQSVAYLTGRAAIRRMGVRRLETWLRNRKLGGAAALAARAVEAVRNQMAALRGEELGRRARRPLGSRPQPVPWDSGKVGGNMRGPRRYHRGLQRALSLSAQVGVFFCPVSKAYCGRKRKEGEGHRQAVLALALARRRVNVLWAVIRGPHAPSRPLQSAADPLGFRWAVRGRYGLRPTYGGLNSTNSPCG